MLTVSLRQLQFSQKILKHHASHGKIWAFKSLLDSVTFTNSLLCLEEQVRWTYRTVSFRYLPSAFMRKHYAKICYPSVPDDSTSIRWTILFVCDVTFRSRSSWSKRLMPQNTNVWYSAFAFKEFHFWFSTRCFWSFTIQYICTVKSERDVTSSCQPCHTLPSVVPVLPCFWIFLCRFSVPLNFWCSLFRPLKSLSVVPVLSDTHSTLFYLLPFLVL